MNGRTGLVRAYVGLGSNLQDPQAQLRLALDGLNRLPDTRVIKCSDYYLTQPVGPVPQADFVNAVCELETALQPLALLRQLLALEARAGRRREGVVRWGPRVLDLDLLVYDQEVINEPELILPHPHLTERAFVLIPFAEIAPYVHVPGKGRVADLVKAVSSAGVARLPGTAHPSA